MTGPTKGVQRRVALVPVPPHAATTAGSGRPVGEGETKEVEGEVEPAKDRTGESATAEVGGRAPGEWVKNAVMEWVWQSKSPGLLGDAKTLEVAAESLRAAQMAVLVLEDWSIPAKTLGEVVAAPSDEAVLRATDEKMSALAKEAEDRRAVRLAAVDAGEGFIANLEKKFSLYKKHHFAPYLRGVMEESSFYVEDGEEFAYLHFDGSVDVGEAEADFNQQLADSITMSGHDQVATELAGLGIETAATTVLQKGDGDARDALRRMSPMVETLKGY